MRERPGLEAFFEPRAVAVIGASGDPAKVGGSVLANLKAAGFPGRLVPVNAARTVVQGLPAVPSILARSTSPSWPCRPWPSCPRSSSVRPGA